MGRGRAGVEDVIWGPVSRPPTSMNSLILLNQCGTAIFPLIVFHNFQYHLVFNRIAILIKLNADCESFKA